MFATLDRHLLRTKAAEQIRTKFSSASVQGQVVRGKLAKMLRNPVICPPVLWNHARSPVRQGEGLVLAIVLFGSKHPLALRPQKQTRVHGLLATTKSKNSKRTSSHIKSSCCLLLPMLLLLLLLLTLSLYYYYYYLLVSEPCQ